MQTCENKGVMESVACSILTFMFLGPGNNYVILYGNCSQV